MFFYAIFQSKSKSIHLFLEVFCVFWPAGRHAWLPGDQYVGVRQKEWGFSQRILPASFWSPGSHMWLPANSYALYIAIRNRVKNVMKS